MANPPLTIVAIIHATPNGRDLVKAELLKLIEPTLKETGCIQYDLHEDNNQPNTFLFFENWETRDLWQAHLQTEHIAAFKKASAGAIESSSIHEMTRQP
jgi:quinol monooxygenase YgiN